MDVIQSVEFLEESREIVFSRWEALTRERVPAARETDSMALRDHLPLIYDEILEATGDFAKNGGRGRTAAQKIVENPAHQEHGRLRASTKGYTVESLIHEYFILEEVVTGLLEESGHWNRDLVEAIHHLIQISVQITVETFSESIQEMQQKILGTLVHDIRTPLCSATLAIGMLAEQKPDGPLREKLDVMVKVGVERALGMLSELLDNVIAEAGDGLMMDFHESDFASEFDNALDEAIVVYGAQIHRETSPSEIRGVFDPAAFRRIMENLISNAVRYGSRDTPVTISIDEVGNSIVLKVHNLGNPIEKDRQELIFQFFSPAAENCEQPSDSWGIGLSFIRLAVDGHQGKLNLTSDEKSGTTFAITLPKVASQKGRVRTKLLKY